MPKLTELDKAQLKHEFRQFYKDKGVLPCYQALYEMILSINILLDVIKEEQDDAKL